MAESEQGKAAARAWMRAEQRQGWRGARPVLALGLAGTGLAVLQALCAAIVLATLLTHGTGALAWPLGTRKQINRSNLHYRGLPYLNN